MFVASDSDTASLEIGVNGRTDEPKDGQRTDRRHENSMPPPPIIGGGITTAAVSETH